MCNIYIYVYVQNSFDFACMAVNYKILNRILHYLQVKVVVAKKPLIFEN